MYKLLDLTVSNCERFLRLSLNLLFTNKVHIVLTVCTVAAIARSGWCERFVFEIGPLIKFNNGEKSVNVPTKSPHTFDDLQFLLDVRLKSSKSKVIDMGLKYFAGESTIKYGSDNPLGLSHISSHLWTIYGSIEKPIFPQLSNLFEVKSDFAAGLGINSERAGFMRGFSRTTHGISYNMSPALSILPTQNKENRKIENYYLKLDVFFLKDTFDYEYLHLDQNAFIGKFRRLSIGEIGLKYLWLSSVSVKLFGRLCHYDRASRFVIGGGLMF